MKLSSSCFLVFIYLGTSLSAPLASRSGLVRRVYDSSNVPITDDCVDQLARRGVSGSRVSPSCRKKKFTSSFSFSKKRPSTQSSKPTTQDDTDDDVNFDHVGDFEQHAAKSNSFGGPSTSSSINPSAVHHTTPQNVPAHQASSGLAQEADEGDDDDDPKTALGPEDNDFSDDDESEVDDDEETDVTASPKTIQKYKNSWSQTRNLLLQEYGSQLPEDLARRLNKFLYTANIYFAGHKKNLGAQYFPASDAAWTIKFDWILKHMDILTQPQIQGLDSYIRPFRTIQEEAA